MSTAPSAAAVNVSPTDALRASAAARQLTAEQRASMAPLQQQARHRPPHTPTPGPRIVTVHSVQSTSVSRPARSLAAGQQGPGPVVLNAPPTAQMMDEVGDVYAELMAADEPGAVVLDRSALAMQELRQQRQQTLQYLQSDAGQAALVGLGITLTAQNQEEVIDQVVAHMEQMQVRQTISFDQFGQMAATGALPSVGGFITAARNNPQILAEAQQSQKSECCLYLIEFGCIGLWIAGAVLWSRGTSMGKTMFIVGFAAGTIVCCGHSSHQAPKGVRWIGLVLADLQQQQQPIAAVAVQPAAAAPAQPARGYRLTD